MVIALALALLSGLVWAGIAWLAGWAMVKTFIIATALTFAIVMALSAANGDDFP